MRKCNTCGETKELHLMVPHVQYKSGYAPLCRECSKKKCKKYWQEHYIHKNNPGGKRYRHFEPDLSILIKNGYAKNEEEAREYAKW